MSRPTTLHEPFKALAEKAGSVTKLREIMGAVPPTTLNRWSQQAMEGKDLPRAAKLAITLAEQKLAERSEP